MSLVSSCLAITAFVLLSVVGCTPDDERRCPTKEGCVPCWSCQFVDAADAGTGTFSYTASDVIAATEGKWHASDADVTVAGTSGPVTIAVPHADITACEIPAQAWAKCAAMKVPADVKIVTAGDTARVDTLIVYGYELAKKGDTPAARDFAGFPSATYDAVSDGKQGQVVLLFGVDALWRSFRADTAPPFSKIGAKE